MIRTLLIIAWIGVLSSTASAQEPTTCSGPCQNAGVEIEDFDIFVSKNGSSCDSWIFVIAGVPVDSDGDICPNLIRYRPQCGRQVPKEGYCILTEQSRNVLLFTPTCVCVDRFLVCLDWECRLGEPVTAEELTCFTEGACIELKID